MTSATPLWKRSDAELRGKQSDRMSLPTANSNVVGMRCIRCGKDFPMADYFEGCPICAAASMPSSLQIDYHSFPATSNARDAVEWLVYPKTVLGEGNTPLYGVAKLAHEIGVAAFSVKFEGANPTGSHKDRMSALLVQRARVAGAKTVAIASSGNAGASLAAYAASAGLECVVVTTPKMNANWRRAITMHGASIILTQTPNERWQLVREKSRSGEWYPANNYLFPAVGSNPFGVDGYRAVAIEMFVQQQEHPITDVLVPTSRGDTLWGVAQGFFDLKRAGLLTTIPRVHAVEPFPRIERVLSGTDYRTSFDGESRMTSLGGNTVAFQAIDALRKTDGSAVSVTEGGVLEDQMRLAKAGLYLELSSAAGLTGLRGMVQNGTIGPKAHAVIVATSHGYKEDP